MWIIMQDSVGVEYKEMWAPYGSSGSTEEILKIKCFALSKLMVHFQLFKVVCMFPSESSHFNSSHFKTGLSEQRDC